MRRAFLYLLLASVLGTWAGATEKLVRLGPLVVNDRGGSAPSWLSISDTLGVAGAFVGAAVVLLLGARRALALGAMAIILASVLGLVDQLSWVAFVAGPIARRVFEVAALSVAASFVHATDQHGFASVLSFVLVREAIVELGYLLFKELEVVDVWGSSAAAGIVLGLAGLGLVVATLRRTRAPASVALPHAPYRASARVADAPETAKPDGSFAAAFPYILGTSMFAIVTTFVSSGGLRCELRLGAIVCAGGLVASIAAWLRAPRLEAEDLRMLGAIAVCSIITVGAEAARLDAFPATLLVVACQFMVLAGVAHSVTVERRRALVAVTILSAASSLQSLLVSHWRPPSYVMMMMLLAGASLAIPGLRARRALRART